MVFPLPDVSFDAAAATALLDACGGAITRLRWFAIVHGRVALAATGGDTATWTGNARRTFDTDAVALQTAVDGCIGSLTSLAGSVRSSWQAAADEQDRRRALAAEAVGDVSWGVGHRLPPLRVPAPDLFDRLLGFAVLAAGADGAPTTLPVWRGPAGSASAVPDALLAFGTAMRCEAERLTFRAAELGDALAGFWESDTDDAFRPPLPAVDDAVRGLAAQATLHGDTVSDVGLAFARAGGTAGVGAHARAGADGLVRLSEAALAFVLTAVRSRQAEQGRALAARIEDLLAGQPDPVDSASQRDRIRDALAELAAACADPDIAAGAVNALGVTGIDRTLAYADLLGSWLLGDAAIGRDAARADIVAPVGLVVAAATHSPALSSAVRADLLGGPTGESPVRLADQARDRLAALLPFGTYATGFLVPAAERVMDATPPMRFGVPLQPNLAAAQALARNPEAACAFLARRPENAAYLVDPHRFPDGTPAGDVIEIGLVDHPAGRGPEIAERATTGAEHLIAAVNESGDVTDRIRQATAAALYPHRDAIAHSAMDAMPTDDPAEPGFQVSDDALETLVANLARDDVARDRMATTAQVYVAEQVQAGVDRLVATGDPRGGKTHFAAAGSLADLFRDGVEAALDSAAEAAAHDARVMGAVQRTLVEGLGSVAAPVSGGWAAPATAAADMGRSVLEFMVDESVRRAEQAAFEAAAAGLEHHQEVAMTAVRATVADTLLNTPGALADPPTVPASFDPDGDGHLDVPAVGTEAYSDYVAWTNGMDRSGRRLAGTEHDRVLTLFESVTDIYDTIYGDRARGARVQA